MPDDQKQTELSPEEKERTALYDEYKRKSYWTFREGMDLVILPIYQGNYPIQYVIGEDLFEDILQAVEAGDLKTINTTDQITKIVDYATFDEPAEMNKHYKEKPGQKFNRFEIITEKQNCFYKKIKIRPAIFIKYIKENFDRFSDIEIPPELEKLLEAYTESEIKKSKINKEQKYIFPGEQLTSWDDLEIILISHESIEIKINGHSKKLSYHELGMAHKQNPDKPQKVWEALKIFAQLDGKIPNKDFPNSNLPKGKDRSIELNNALKTFFNLNKSIYKDHFRTHRSWETKFKISSQLEISPLQDDESSSLFESEVQEKIKKTNLSDSQLYKK